MLGDVAEPEQVLLAECWIIAVLGRRLPAVLGPPHHVVHRARRPVAIRHLQRQFLWREFRLNALQRQSDVALRHAFGRVIAGQRPAYKVRPGIADVLKDAG